MSSEEKKSEDVVIIIGQSDAGNLQGIRQREGEIALAEFSPLKEGSPIQGELVSLKPREDAPAICDVEVLYEPPAAPKAGPARVSNDAYRDGWDRIFGATKNPAHELPN